MRYKKSWRSTLALSILSSSLRKFLSLNRLQPKSHPSNGIPNRKIQIHIRMSQKWWLQGTMTPRLTKNFLIKRIRPGQIPKQTPGQTWLRWKTKPKNMKKSPVRSSSLSWSDSSLSPCRLLCLTRSESKTKDGLSHRWFTFLRKKY